MGTSPPETPPRAERASRALLRQTAVGQTPGDARGSRRSKEPRGRGGGCSVTNRWVGPGVQRSTSTCRQRTRGRGAGSTQDRTVFTPQITFHSVQQEHSILRLTGYLSPHGYLVSVLTLTGCKPGFSISLLSALSPFPFPLPLCPPNPPPFFRPL